MRRYIAVASSTLLALVPLAAHAQESAVLPGDRVRLTMNAGPRVDGTVTYVSRDSVIIARDANVRSVVQAADIRRVQAFVGHSHAAGAVRGALVGAVIGTAFGAVATAQATPNTANCTNCDTAGQVGLVLFTGYAFGLLGEWIGAFVGRDQWRAAQIRTPSMRITQAARPTPLPTVDPGLRIRVTAPGVVADRLEGVVLQSTPDSLVLATPNGIRFAIPAPAIAELRRPVSSARAGAATGAAWGAAMYAPMWIFGTLDSHARVNVLGLMAEMTVTGTSLGAIVGGLKRKEVWEVIPPRE